MLRGAGHSHCIKVAGSSKASKTYEDKMGEESGPDMINRDPNQLNGNLMVSGDTAVFALKRNLNNFF